MSDQTQTQERIDQLYGNVVAAMANSGDPLLRVIADLEPVSKEIFDLCVKYNKASKAGEENVPRPMDFLAGMAIFLVNQFTIHARSLFPEDKQDQLQDLLIGIVISPPEVIMNDLLKNAGILDALREKYGEVLKQWQSSHPNSESKSQPQSSKPE